MSYWDSRSNKHALCKYTTILYIYHCNGTADYIDVLLSYSLSDIRDGVCVIMSKIVAVVMKEFSMVIWDALHSLVLCETAGSQCVLGVRGAL